MSITDNPKMTDSDIVERCVAARRSRQIPLATLPGEINTDYIEGMDPDGSINANRQNAFDDLHVIYTFNKEGKPVLLFKAECTTQPGARYTLRPINPEGAAIADLGYQVCWQTGLHRGNYPALIQTGGSIRVWRDRSKTYARGGENKLTSGWFGINQHHGGDAPRTDIGSHSAGCLVTRSVKAHERALEIKKGDPRYVANRQFVFSACIMPASWVLNMGDQDARPRPSIQPKPPKGLGTGLTGAFGGLASIGAYVQDHWAILTVIALAIGISTFVYLWREPYATPNQDVWP